MRAVYGRAHPHRPAHAARRLPAPARRRSGELPARVGRAGQARAALLHRLRRSARLLRGGGDARRARGRLPRVRPHREARADGGASRRRPGAAGEPLRRRRDTRPLRPRQRHGGRACRRRRRDRSAARKRACVSETQSPLGALNHAADARSGHVRKGRRADPRAHPRRGRVPGRPLAACGAPDVRVRARALPGAAPRQPLALPLPPRARRARAGGLLAGDARQVRGRPSQPEPDRGHDAPGRRRRRAPARLGEGPRGARDARRPRPQRPLARLQACERPRGALPRARALLPRHAPRLGGDRRAAGGRDGVRPAARLLPGRHRLRRPEGARDADRLGARGLPPRPVRRRRRLRAPGRRDGHVHRDPDDRPRGRRRPAAGRRGDRGRLGCRPPSTRSA